MKPKVYLETTIPSYLTARPSRDLICAGRQQLTRQWWDSRRCEFDLYVSSAVLDEVSAGDPSAAAERLRVLETLPILDLTAEATGLAAALLRSVPLSAKSSIDALHVAIAAVGGMDYLLTWNCRHLANATLRHTIATIITDSGFEPALICTPDELLGG